MIGTTVFYLLPGGNNPGDYRPAMVTRAWPNGICTLSVFTDLVNDDLGGPILVVQSTEGDGRGQFARTVGGTDVLNELPDSATGPAVASATPAVDPATTGSDGQNPATGSTVPPPTSSTAGDAGAVAVAGSMTASAPGATAAPATRVQP